MNYRWTFKTKNHDDSTIKNLATELKIPESLAKVLSVRGINTSQEAEHFFKPSLDDIHDPFIMKDMQKAVDRILKAVDDKELIWVHGDYDVDGTASTSLLCKFLREIGGNCEYYIPDRFEDGFGLSNKSIDLAKQRGASVLISVDVGITATEQFKYAKEHGFDSIICDHHEPGDKIPECYAILDPIMKDSNYPFPYLAACGVVFKFVQGISKQLGKEEMAFEYLDFVAIASIADMVPLLGENRALVHFGLKLVNKHTRPGLQGLIYCTGLKTGAMTASNIVFAVAPLINAAGRLGDAKRSVEMMMQNDENAAFRIAQELEDENRKRRLFDQKTFQETIPIAKKLIKERKVRSLVLHRPHWHAGVIGIVASRLVDKFNLPTILLTTIDGYAKGSARSVNNFDIHSALKKCEDILIEFGGHKHASGLTLKEENVEELRTRFDDIAKEHISNEMLVPEILIDTELKFSDLSPKFLQTLDKFAPYGFQNNKPVFYAKGVKSVNGVKIVGHNSIRFRAMQSNFVIDAIGQNLAHKIGLTTGGKKFSIVFNLETSSFNGRKSPQLTIKDIRPD